MTQIGANQLKKKKSVPVAPRLPPEKKNKPKPKKNHQKTTNPQKTQTTPTH